MNALAHKNDVTIVRDTFDQKMRGIKECLLGDIFLETRRINKKGYTITVSLLSSFLSIYVHEGAEIVKDFTADYDDADELISVLEQLEQIKAPTTVPEEVYDLE